MATLEGWLLLAWFSTILYVVYGSMHNHDEVEANNFEVKPGAGRQNFVRQWGGIECSFSYKAQGGTKEQWLMTVAHDVANSEWVCTVERPGGHSYLFFEEFRLHVNGAKLQHATAEKDGGVLLDSSEYIIVKHANYVQQSDGKFQSQLTRVQIYATDSASATSGEL